MLGLTIHGDPKGGVSNNEENNNMGKSIRVTMLCENQKQLARMIKINLINCSDGVLSQFLKVYLTTQNALYNPNKIK
jgi:hypothetical protein